MERVLEALQTGGGMLWKALWALVLGYMISAGVQVLVTRKQMAEVLGRRGAKEAGIASVFGLISSSCSFAALAASRSVLVKGAHPSNALAFLIASTNLVIELGIVLWILLGWKFTLANFLLGGFMISYAYLLSGIALPQEATRRAREHAEKQQRGEGMGMMSRAEGSWREKISSWSGLRQLADAFFMEWKMVWKEILFGFAVAGFISVFVPQSVWNALFLQGGASPSFWVVVENAAIAPVVAFFTFIGSMGNVPLAAMLWSKNASFGGVMSFLGADLVAATVLYIHWKYYGARYTLYMSALLYVCMVGAGLTVHYLYALAGILPTARPELREMVRFGVDYTLWLNLAFGLAGLALVWVHASGGGSPRHQATPPRHGAQRSRAASR